MSHFLGSVLFKGAMWIPHYPQKKSGSAVTLLAFYAFKQMGFILVAPEYKFLKTHPNPYYLETFEKRGNSFLLYISPWIWQKRE